LVEVQGGLELQPAGARRRCPWGAMSLKMNYLGIYYINISLFKIILLFLRLNKLI